MVWAIVCTSWRLVLSSVLSSFNFDLKIFEQFATQNNPMIFSYICESQRSVLNFKFSVFTFLGLMSCFDDEH